MSQRRYQEAAAVAPMRNTRALSSTFPLFRTGKQLIHTLEINCRVLHAGSRAFKAVSHIDEGRALGGPLNTSDEMVDCPFVGEQPPKNPQTT